VPWPAALEMEKGVQMWSLRRRESWAPRRGRRRCPGGGGGAGAPSVHLVPTGPL